MSRTQLDGARELLADAIRESIKRGRKLTQVEWEAILTQYDQVATATDRERGMAAKYRLAGTLDRLILDLDPDDN